MHIELLALTVTSKNLTRLLSALGIGLKHEAAGRSTVTSDIKDYVKSFWQRMWHENYCI
jgi:hypothetical protein